MNSLQDVHETKVYRGRSTCLSECFNLRKVRWVLMKFGMCVKQLEPPPPQPMSYSSFPAAGNNIADAHTYEVWATPVPKSSNQIKLLYYNTRRNQLQLYLRSWSKPFAAGRASEEDTGSQGRHKIKYDLKSRENRKQELLCWRGPAAIQ
jgi:hypothetical protein